MQWSRRGLALAAAGVACVAWTISATQVLLAARTDRAEPADAIVVLGAAHYRGKPSPVLRARLDHAVVLYDRGIASRVVLTGGVAEGDTASEAAVGRTYALAAGVPDSALLLEHEGRTTAQSLEHVATLLHRQGLSRVVLVSDPFHVLRARRTAERAGLQAVASPTRTDDTWRRLVRQPGYFLAESVKAPLAILFAW